MDWLAETFRNDEGIDLRNDRQALQRLTEAAEKAKIELSTLTQTTIRQVYIYVYHPSSILFLFFHFSSDFTKTINGVFLTACLSLLQHKTAQNI